MGSFVAVCGTPSTKTGVALGCLAGLALGLVSVCMNTGVAASGACSSEFTVSQSIQGSTNLHVNMRKRVENIR